MRKEIGVEFSFLSIPNEDDAMVVGDKEAAETLSSPVTAACARQCGENVLGDIIH